VSLERAETLERRESMPKYQYNRPLPRDAQGNLEEFVWPGGYPIYYLDGDGTILCQTCANAPTDVPSFQIRAWGYLQPTDDAVDCDNCSDVINAT